MSPKFPLLVPSDNLPHSLRRIDLHVGSLVHLSFAFCRHSPLLVLRIYDGRVLDATAATATSGVAPAFV